MRLPLPLVLLALAALATLARADEYTSIAQFGLTYLTCAPSFAPMTQPS